MQGARSDNKKKPLAIIVAALCKYDDAFYCLSWPPARLVILPFQETCVKAPKI